MSYETDLIKKIKGGMFAIKNKTITPKDAKLGVFFLKLKEVNEGMFEELLKEYKVIYKVIYTEVTKIPEK